MSQDRPSNIRRRGETCPECGASVSVDDDYCPECDASLDDRSGGKRKKKRRLPEHRGQMIQIMGILSFFFVPLVLGPIAWIMGRNDLKLMERGEMDPAGHGETRTGMICGMIATIIWGTIFLIGIAIFIIYFGIVLALFGSFCCCATGAATTTTPPPSQTGPR